MNDCGRQIVTIIQIRRESTRLPDKALMPLAGKPLFVQQVRRIQAASLAGTVVVATTPSQADDSIVEICRQEGIECFRGHAADLLDRHYRAACHYEADIVLKIPSDCPLIDPAIIDQVITYYLHHEHEYDYVSNLHPATWPDGNDVEIMPLEVLKKAHAHASLLMEREHTTPYIWERPEQFRIGNVVMEGGLNYSMTHRWTIDYQADYQFIQAVYEQLYSSDPLFGVREILELLEKRPDIYRINASLAGVNWYRHHLDELKTISPGETRNPSMTNSKLQRLQSIALRVREHIIRMSAGGGCFIGASLSCVELMVYLYSEFLRHGPKGGSDPHRDYLFLSKGHDVPALYGTFVELGLLDPSRLDNHLSTTDHIYWHPNRAIPGVEFHSGSLGHLPAVAAGVALDCRLRGGDNRVIVITGDGELNEGSVWETILVANAQKLDNLTLIVDRNQFQANIRTEELVPLEPLADKFRAFGCRVRRVDGHDLLKLEEAFRELPVADGTGGMNVIIADTVRGKGLPSIEARADRWFCAFTASEIEQLLQELHGLKEEVFIASESLVVR